MGNLLSLLSDDKLPKRKITWEESTKSVNLNGNKDFNNNIHGTINTLKRLLNIYDGKITNTLIEAIRKLNDYNSTRNNKLMIIFINMFNKYNNEQYLIHNLNIINHNIDNRMIII